MRMEGVHKPPRGGNCFRTNNNIDPTIPADGQKNRSKLSKICLLNKKIYVVPLVKQKEIN